MPHQPFPAQELPDEASARAEARVNAAINALVVLLARQAAGEAKQHAAFPNDEAVDEE